MPRLFSLTIKKYTYNNKNNYNNLLLIFNSKTSIKIVIVSKIDIVGYLCQAWTLSYNALSVCVAFASSVAQVVCVFEKTSEVKKF